jgi:NAD(P)-dependent dehydrogenase (short-subunit alcohol dehydrogenase family)
VQHSAAPHPTPRSGRIAAHTQHWSARVFTAADLPDLRGRTAVVTGASSGLGLETARLLARAGATVVMTARTRAKHDAAEADVRRTDPDADLRFQQLELADLGNVRDAAAALAAAHPRLDVLVNNAGVMMTPEATTADGLELQLGTNHFGHFALTGLLLGPLLAADGARVVTVSSGAHHLGRMDFGDLHQQHAAGYDTVAQYARSKLANLLFALELQRQFDAAGVAARSVAAHPGYTATNLQRAGVRMPGGGLVHKVLDVGMRVLNPLVGMRVEQGVQAQVHAAVADVPGGSYWGPQGFREMRGPVGPARIGPRARDADAARRLWEISVETTGVDYAALDRPAP